MKFDEAYNKMPGLLKTLKRSKAVRSGGRWQKNRAELPKKGVYVFYENGRAMYIGRSNNLSSRIEGHGAASGTQYGATFAFKLLKEKVGEEKCQGKTRKEIQAEFTAEYQAERVRVRNMEVKVVEVNDQVEQAIFEIYAILALRTTPKYNEFRTT